MNIEEAMARMGGPEEKKRIEAMVTAILLQDPPAQAVAAEGIGPEAERMLRSAGGIISSFFVVLGPRLGMSPIEAWRIHMRGTMESRGGTG